MSEQQGGVGEAGGRGAVDRGSRQPPGVPPVAPTRCIATTAEGVRCKITSGPSAGGFCVWHDDSRRAEAQAARRRGGKAAGAKRSKIVTVDPDQAPDAPEDLDDVLTWLSWITVGTVTGRIDARTAETAVKALRAMKEALHRRGDEEFQASRERLRRLGLEA